MYFLPTHMFSITGYVARGAKTAFGEPLWITRASRCYYHVIVARSETPASVTLEYCAPIAARAPPLGTTSCSLCLFWNSRPRRRVVPPQPVAKRGKAREIQNKSAFKREIKKTDSPLTLVNDSVGRRNFSPTWNWHVWMCVLDPHTPLRSTGRLWWF